MKKVLLVLLLVISFGFFGIQLSAVYDEKGNIVVHFKAWDEDYTNLGSWAWGGPAAGKVYDGIDDFGAYWEYNDIPVGTSVGFIAVMWPGGADPNWDQKLTGDVNIDASAVVAGETTHVYVFEGAATSAENPGHYIAKHDKKNLLVVYYDPAGAYEDNVGVHAWGWVGVTALWGTPLPFTVAGKTDAVIDMKASIFAEESGGGLFIYAGDEANKKSADIKMDQFPDAHIGEASVAYVVNKNSAYLTGDNIYKDDYATFAEEAFSFKLMGFDVEKMSGTYAPDPYTVIVKTSAPVASPYATADDKDAARAEIENWFTIREKGTNNIVPISHVDFSISSITIDEFTIRLEESLDNISEYEVLFDLGFPNEDLAIAKDVTVTIFVKIPINTPGDAVLSIVGNVTNNGWTPGLEDFTATQIGDSNVYEVTFNVLVTETYTTFEYKWTRGDWSTEEFIATNRPLVIPNNVDSIVIEDEVEAWSDIDAPAEKYPAPIRVVVLNRKAILDLFIYPRLPMVIYSSSLDNVVSKGVSFKTEVKVNIENLVGYQLKLVYDDDNFELIGIDIDSVMEASAFYNTNTIGEILFNYDNINNPLSGEMVLFSLEFKPKQLPLHENYDVFTLDDTYFHQFTIYTSNQVCSILNVSSDFDTVRAEPFGDINKDGQVNIADIVSIQLYLAKLETFNESTLQRVDVNNDGKISIADVTMLQMFLANLITEIGPK